MSSIKNNIMQSVKAIILALLLIVGVNYAFAVDWTPPTATPPSGNTAAPINVSTSGQVKDGGLWLNAAHNSNFGLVVSTQSSPLGFVVQNDGNVGIGAGVQATAALDVGGQIKMRGGSPGAGKVLTSDANGLATWETLASGSSLWTAGSNNSISNSNTGNVGIGTANPATKLEVKGTGNQYIKLSSNATNVDVVSQYFDGTNNAYSGLLGAAAGAGKWGVYTGGATRMVVDQSGNVGIGRNSPAYMLDVDGNTSINGKLRIGEVGGSGVPAANKVLTSTDSSGNASWQKGTELGIYEGQVYAGALICNDIRGLPLTPNKPFLVTATGNINIINQGPNLVSFSINGVVFTQHGSYVGGVNLNGNQIAGSGSPFTIQHIVNSSAAGCFQVPPISSYTVPENGAITISVVG